MTGTRLTRTKVLLNDRTTSSIFLRGKYRIRHKMSVYHDEIEIEDFEYDEDTETYYYPCPCGDRFEISKVNSGSKTKQQASTLKKTKNIYCDNQFSPT